MISTSQGKTELSLRLGGPKLCKGGELPSTRWRDQSGSLARHPFAGTMIERQRFVKIPLILPVGFLWGYLALQVPPPQSPTPAINTPQELVQQYTKLGQAGELLTVEGWNQAQIFFLHHSQFFQEIYVTENYAAKLAWIKDDKAEVDQEYEPIGKIDPSLRFTAPPGSPYLKMSIAFNIALTEKHGNWEQMEKSANWHLRARGESKIRKYAGPPLRLRSGTRCK